MSLTFILILVGVLFLALFLFRNIKKLKLSSLVFISGGVKTGKSTLGVYLVRKEYKSRLIKTKIKNFFLKLFKKPLKDLPLIYSNVPLAMPYVPITSDLLMRKTRFVYGSVIYVQEYSLVADSQLIRDMDTNEALLMLHKLIGHETKGGIMIVDSQQVQDVHYTLKRSLSNYIYSHHLTKWIPFILIAHVQELMYSDDGSLTSTFNEDVEETLKTVIIPKSTWKYFDCYCYSCMTDDLPVEKTIVDNSLKTKDLKARKIFTFRKGGVVEKHNEKEND